jgi:hypothetical protein
LGALSGQPDKHSAVIAYALAQGEDAREAEVVSIGLAIEVETELARGMIAKWGKRDGWATFGARRHELMEDGVPPLNAVYEALEAAGIDRFQLEALDRLLDRKLA